MKKILLAGTAIAALIASPALAADLGARAPVYTAAPPVMAAYNWSGIYIGAQVGAIWGDADYSIPANGFAASYNLDGSVIGGGHIGGLLQTGPWVFGIEGDINGSGA